MENMIDENGDEWMVGDDCGWDPIMGDYDDWIETDDEWLDDFQGEEEWAWRIENGLIDYTQHERKGKKKMIEILYILDCCGAYLADCHVEYGICPDCQDHCEVVREEYTIAN